MKSHCVKFGAFIICLLWLTGGGSLAAGQDEVDHLVAGLIENALKPNAQTEAFGQLEALGCMAVPSIIRRMDDRRKLPISRVSLENKSPDAFEAVRHYSPELMVDALAAILNQVTGEHFGFIYNGASETERAATIKKWREYLDRVGPGGVCGKGGLDKSPTVLVDGGDFDCLPISTFGLKGIRLWQSEDTVVTILGRPQSITHGWGEDDGGRYDVKTYHYNDLEIDIVRGNVDRIYTKSSKVRMPSGISVGHTAKQVIQILGRKPRNWQGTHSEFSIVTCPEKGVWIQEDYVTLTFDGNGIVQSIDYAANRP